jgi:hypothetical protein
MQLWKRGEVAQPTLQGQACALAACLQSGPRASLYLTLIGILAGFLSTFWNFSYTRMGRKMQRYLEAPPGVVVPKQYFV